MGFLPTSEDLTKKFLLCFRYCWYSGILTWVVACPTEVGHSTLVILSKTAKFGVCLHTEYFKSLFLLHKFILKTSFMMGSALIWLRRWKCILQPWLSGGRERAELLVCLPRLTRPRARRKGKRQGQGQSPAAPCAMGAAKPLTQLNAEP